MRMLAGAVVVTATMLGLVDAAGATTATRETFGTMPNGTAVPAVVLANGHGISARVIAYGAGLQSLEMPDREGNKANVLLGYAGLDQYLAKPQYFGATVGRFANRIAAGKFTLKGKDYQVPVNDGANSLHGGTIGFDKVVWQVVKTSAGPTASVTLRYVSRDGDQGYPGTLTVDATYSLNEADELRIDYTATTDKPTIVNITNHAYWNLAGEGSPGGAMGHVVMIPAASYLPTDKGSIPTGEVRSVAGTVFDFRKPTVVGLRVRDAADQQIAFGRGYDHNWVVGRSVTPDVHLMATATDPVSGRGFEMWSNQPGVQFYSGNFLDGTSYGTSHHLYREGDSVVFEPQIFPDTPNRPSFGSAELDPGQTYRNVIVYKLKTGR